MEVEEQGRPARRRARRAERELYGNPDRAVHCQDILGTQPLAALMYVLWYFVLDAGPVTCGRNGFERGSACFSLGLSSDSTRANRTRFCASPNFSASPCRKSRRNLVRDEILLALIRGIYGPQMAVAWYSILANKELYIPRKSLVSGLYNYVGVWGFATIIVCLSPSHPP